MCCEPVISRTVLVATAGSRVSAKLAQRRVRQLTILDVLPLFVCQIYDWATRPGLVGIRTVSTIFNAVSHKRATRQDVRLDNQGRNKVVVLGTGDSVEFRPSGSTRKTRKERCLRLRRAASSPPIVIEQNLVKEVKTG